MGPGVQRFRRKLDRDFVRRCTRELEEMWKSVLSLSTVFLVFVLVGAKPIPQYDQNDYELISPDDTRHYAYAFWLGRPYYERTDNGGENTYYNSPWKRRSSTVSYANVGAGWGR